MKYLKIFEDFFPKKSPLNLKVSEKELLKYNLETYEIPHYDIDLLGYSGNGVAFDIGMDRVAKLTTDIKEYKSCEKIKNSKVEYLVKVYECGRAYWQGDGYSSDGLPLYFIIKEKLRDLKPDIKEIIEISKSENYPGKQELFRGDYESEKIEPWIDEFFTSDYYQSLARQVFKQLTYIIREANELGIPANDLGKDNIGLRHDKLVYFDMG